MDLVSLTATVLLAVLVASTGNAILWLFRERRAWRVIKPYPLATRMAITSPFSRRWRSLIHAADLDVVTSFRKGFILNYYVLLVVPLVLLWLLLTALSYASYLQAQRDLRQSEHRLEQLRQTLDERP